MQKPGEQPGPIVGFMAGRSRREGGGIGGTGPAYFEAVWFGTVKTVSWPPSAVYFDSAA